LTLTLRQYSRYVKHLKQLAGEIGHTGDPDMLTNYFEISKEELAAKAVTNPRAAVAADVAMLRTIPALPGEWLVSGLVYNVTTGLIDIIVPPAPLRDKSIA